MLVGDMVMNIELHASILLVTNSLL